MKDFKTSIKTVISHETGNTGVFLVSNNGEIKYRTAAELLSDIGGIGSSYIQSGTAAGQLMYWNGSAWITTSTNIFNT